MGRASFEYDEVGNTFYYVLVSFYALFLLPATYFLLPIHKVEVEKVSEHECHCSGCDSKRQRKAQDKPWRRTKQFITFFGLGIAWLIFFFIAKKCMEIEPTHKDYDPYEILGVDQGAEISDVKKAYRDLTKKHHPDKGGDPVLFDRIAKAYQALTDKVSAENWEKYGNPDGPQATTFGIALPKWIVSEEYGLWVLAFYGLVFMIIMPGVVGIWWYSTIKYSVDKVLLDTTKMYYYFIHRTPRMEINRMLHVLSGSFEFCKANNKEVVERESDERELPRLMKSFPTLSDRSGRDGPLSMPYALKARILIYAHLSRTPLDSEGGALDADQRYLLTRILRLIEEMINASNALVYYQNRIPLETFDNLMRLQPMFVQALWPKNSPLLQLPHINDHHLQYLRKNRVFSCHDLAQMDGEKRRLVLRSLSDQEYRDIMVVLTNMPRLNIQAKCVVMGEDDSHELTAGCVVTMKVTLNRSSLLDTRAAGLEDQHRSFSDNDDDAEDVSGSDDDDEEKKQEDGSVKKTRKPWEKQNQKKKVGGKKKGGAKKPLKKPTTSPAASPTEATVEKVATPAEPKNDKKEKPEKSESGSEFSDSDDEINSDSESGKDNSKETDDEWDGELSNKKISFETKTVETHRVHSPFYPVDKYEWWWLSLTHTDKKEKTKVMVSAPQLVKTLVTEQTIDIRFGAPQEKGIYSYQLSVKSDSYMDAEYSVDIKLDVKEAKTVELKHEDYDDEEDGDDVSSEGEYTEGSISDEDD